MTGHGAPLHDKTLLRATMNVFRVLLREGKSAKARGLDPDQAQAAILPGLHHLMIEITHDDPALNNAFRAQLVGVRRAERTARRYDCRNSENVNGNRVSARAPYFGGREETYAAMLTRSSSVSFATTGFIRSAHSPWRAPACMSNICRTM